MLSLTSQQKRMTVAVLSAIVLLGGALRLYDLASRTMAHIEIYVPGIELPSDLANPQPRYTIRQTLTSMLTSEEPHPPGYYLVMLGWTKWLGSGILALRLPSVLFGVASIMLVFLLGALEEDTTPALLAAGLLAFNGLHVFWSQLAKMYSMACFLGLLSTVLLVLVSKGRARGLVPQFLYLGATLIGLATTVWFWSLLFTHMFWTWRGNLTRKTMPGLLRWQWVVLILGSPLLSLAIFQARRPSYLSPDPLVLFRGLSAYLGFGFLFEPDGHSIPPTQIPTSVIITLILVASILFGLGLVSSRQREQEEAATSGPSSAILALTGAFAFLFILRLAKFTHGFDADQTRLVVASGMVPVLLSIAHLLIRRCWHFLQRLGVSLYNKGLTLSCVPDALSSLLAVLPAGMIALISPVVPLFASRGLLLYTPYLILVLSRGLVALRQRTRFWTVVAAFLAVVHPLSVLHYRNLHHAHPTDYKALAEQWIPEIEDSDLIFVEGHWATTPIFYYVRADRYHFVGSDYSQELRKHPGSRVWVLSFEDIPMLSPIEEALDGYQIQKTIEARWIRALLYRKP